MSRPNEDERRRDSTERSDKLSDDALSQDELDNVAGGIRAASPDAAAAGADRFSGWGSSPTEGAAGSENEPRKR